MKTKNFLLTGALLIVALFSVNGVMAQTQAPDKTGNTTVNIVLKKIQAILVNDKAVNLEYTTIANYNEGVETSKENHLTVYSVGGFTVSVKAESDFKNEDSNLIPASDVKITATPAGGSPDTSSPVELSQSAKVLITSATGGFEKNYDVNYSTKNTNGNAFQYAKHLEGTYTAVVTYDIAPN